MHTDNESNTPLCGVCSDLMQLISRKFVVLVEGNYIEEIRGFGEKSILQTIHFITCRIKFSYYILLYLIFFLFDFFLIDIQ